jgi:hypothetical protein
VSGQPPKRVQGIRGLVSVGPYGVGSKSEREAVYIDVDGTPYVLRRKTGPVFADAELQTFVGKRVVCDGYIVGHTLLVERIGEAVP